MHYREILQDELKHRQALNPRYSLRAFAAKLGISPSKISEVIAGKKRLSVKRLEDMALKLNLKGIKRQMLTLSAEIEGASVRSAENQNELKLKLKKLTESLNAERTTQKNAWYFGAVKALQEKGLRPEDFQKALGLTSLQIENATRFLKRIQKTHPEREELSFEPLSLIKKINDSFESSQNPPEVDFAFLTEDEFQELKQKIKSFIKKSKISKDKPRPQNLKMIYFGQAEVIKGEH